MNEKTRLHTTLDSKNLTALKRHAINNGFKLNQLLDEVVEQFLENEEVRITIWLPISYVEFLRFNGVNFERVIRERLAMEAFVASENGEITRDEADELVKQLGFKRGLEEI